MMIFPPSALFYDYTVVIFSLPLILFHG